MSGILKADFEEIHMKTYRAAVIGLGQIGLTYDLDPKREKPSSHVLAYTLNPRVDLVAAADIREEQGIILKKTSPGTKFYLNPEELLRNHELDIISICTPPVNHLSIISYIIQKTSVRFIFCEKPLVNSLSETDELRQQLQKSNCLMIPNLSRRWNRGMQRIKETILSGKLGQLQKIHIRYTRGIFNTGAHVFDLLHWWAGPIDMVQVLRKVRTSSENQNELSFTFAFSIGSDIQGFAEAFDDTQYYLFEIDLYFSQGKIEIRNSGNSVYYYKVGEHPLYSGFRSLRLECQENNLLAESNLANAVDNLVGVLDGKSQPACTVDDGLYPLSVGDALLRSYNNKGTEEKVVWQ